MATKFETCIAFTLGPSVEGGFSDNPADPGGATNHGVSIRAHRDDIGDKDHDGDIDADDVRLLTVEEAKVIFRNDYFDPCHADMLPAPLALMLVDFAYNSGVGVACRKLQDRLGVAADGKIGPHTCAIANSLSPDLMGAVINAYGASRLAYLRSLPTWPKFGNGWETRVLACMAAARKLAGG